MLFYQFGYYAVFRALPVARYFRNPDHFVVQHISNAREKDLGLLLCSIFHLLAHKNRHALKNRQTNIIFIKSKLFI